MKVCAIHPDPTHGDAASMGLPGGSAAVRPNRIPFVHALRAVAGESLPPTNRLIPSSIACRPFPGFAVANSGRA